MLFDNTFAHLGMKGNSPVIHYPINSKNVTKCKQCSQQISIERMRKNNPEEKPFANYLKLLKEVPKIVVKSFTH